MANRILKPNMGRSIWTPGQKPPYGAKLNPRHPLSQGLMGAWLFNEGGGSKCFDNINNMNGAEAGIGTSVLWQDDGLKCTANSKYISIPHNSIQNPSSLSIFIRFTALTASSDKYIFNKGVSSTTGYGFSLYRAVPFGVMFFDRRWTNYLETSNPGQYTPPCLVNYSVSADGNGLTVYTEGQRKNSNATAFGGNNSPANINLDYNDSDTIIYHCLYLWNRRLTDAEHASIYADPYQMFDWPLQDFLMGEISAEDFSGWSDLIRNTLKLDYGASTYAGDQLRKTGKYSIGSLPSVGTATKKTTKTFEGIWSSIADLVAQLVGAAQKFYQDCISVLTPAGIILKKSTHNFIGDLTSIGTMVRKGIKSLAGTTAYIGDITKFIGKKIIRTLSTLGELLAQKSGIIYQVCLAGLTFSAQSIKSSTSKLSGAIQNIGTVIKKTLPKSFSGILNSSAKIIKMPITLAKGTANFGGTISRFVYKKIIGAFTSIGELLTQKTGAIYKSLAAGMTFSGRIIKSYSMKLSGVFQDLGAIIKKPLKIVKGGFTTAATVARLRGRILTAILSSTGTIYRKTFTELKSNLNQSGSLIKSINIILISIKSLIGDLLTRVFRTIIGILHHRTYFVPFMDREILLPTDGRTYVIEKDDNTYEINE